MSMRQKADKQYSNTVIQATSAVMIVNVFVLYSFAKYLLTLVLKGAI